VALVNIRLNWPAIPKERGWALILLFIDRDLREMPGSRSRWADSLVGLKAEFLRPQAEKRRLVERDHCRRASRGLMVFESMISPRLPS